MIDNINQESRRKGFEDARSWNRSRSLAERAGGIKMEVLEHEIIDYSTIDRECINFCKAINSIEGLHSIESCCGHGKTPYHIFFQVEDLKNLPILL